MSFLQWIRSSLEEENHGLDIPISCCVNQRAVAIRVESIEVNDIKV
jgi:hypothetical protein